MTCEPIHPGEMLREDLDALGMSGAELARRIEVRVNRITQILNASVPLRATLPCVRVDSSGCLASSGSTCRSFTN